MASTIVVKGLDELVRDLRRAGQKADAKTITDELRRLAKLVTTDARRHAERYGSRTARGIKPSVRGGTALVRQSIAGHRVRPSFGALLMRNALLPGLAENEREIYTGMDNLVDRILYESHLD